MSSDAQSYQVLARKYRPKNFDQLIGQEVLVQTLTNAIDHKKIAHAFILTGIRGVGKTTSARIIAKALNCIGEDGEAKEARIPCGTCSNCKSIDTANFQDVLEMDAASRTGVDDIRSIIDSVSYAPAIGRYKVYIIDEVHMLSTNAFNALLKTLEEPPAHTKFIFATTEIKKIPVTVLSRCQRFDLRRLGDVELENYLESILEKEGFKSEKGVLSLIASLSQGSVRDSLSILDRALSCNNYEAMLPMSLVEELVGSNDKSLAIDLFELLIKGNIDGALEKFGVFYDKSSDISSLIQDLLEVNHKATLYKSIKDLNSKDMTARQLEKIKQLSSQTSILDLTRLWQVLLKGVTEIVNSKVNQKIIFEMLMVRICHLSDIPNLEQVIKKIKTLEKNDEVIIVKDEEVSQKEISNNMQNDFSGEILRNFTGAKIVS